MPAPAYFLDFTNEDSRFGPDLSPTTHVTFGVYLVVTSQFTDYANIRKHTRTFHIQGNFARK